MYLSKKIKVVRWSGGQVVRWSGGQVVRWSGGQVVRWFNYITKNSFRVASQV